MALLAGNRLPIIILYKRTAVPAGSVKGCWSTTCGRTGTKPVTPHFTDQQLPVAWVVLASNGTMLPTKGADIMTMRMSRQSNSDPPPPPPAPWTRPIRSTGTPTRTRGVLGLGETRQSLT